VSEFKVWGNYHKPTAPPTKIEVQGCFVDPENDPYVMNHEEEEEEEEEDNE
jgi:hypothetical protein